MSKNILAQVFCAVSLFVCSTPIFATQLTIIDSDGKPVEHVVISITSNTNGASKAPTDIAIMDQADYQFLPKVLVVSKDQWVDFPNSDNVRHHIYSFSSPKPFEIKMFNGAEAEKIQFNKPGIVVLGCNIHDSMVGYIYIADQEISKSSNKQGKIEIVGSDIAGLKRDKNANSMVKATLWHPLLSPSNTKRIDIQIDTNLSEQVIQLDIQQTLFNVEKKSKGFSSKFKKNN